MGKKLIGGGMLIVAVAMIGRLGEQPTDATAPVRSTATAVSTDRKSVV